MDAPAAARPKATRTKPAEVRLEELMAAAEALFLEKGVEATTVSEIVERAGVAKGTFYHYFSAKHEMLEALERRYTQQFLASLEMAVSACGAQDWHGRLRAWITASVAAYAQTYRTHDMVYTNHHHLDRDNPARNAILAQLLRIIEGGAQAGVWAAPRPRMAALLIYAGVHGATDDLIASRAEAVAPFAQALADNCLRLLPPPGGPAADGAA